MPSQRNGCNGGVSLLCCGQGLTYAAEPSKKSADVGSPRSSPAAAAARSRVWLRFNQRPGAVKYCSTCSEAASDTAAAVRPKCRCWQLLREGGAGTARSVSLELACLSVGAGHGGRPCRPHCRPRRPSRGFCRRQSSAPFQSPAYVCPVSAACLQGHASHKQVTSKTRAALIK